MGRYFVLPSPEIQRRVNQAFGSDQYRRLSDTWNLAVIQAQKELGITAPPWTAEQQTRFALPEELRGVEGRADPTSTHYLGLARDVGWGQWPNVLRERVARILEARGLAVERTRKGALFPRHLHFGIPKAEVRRLGLVPLIEKTVQALRRNRLQRAATGR